VTWGRAEEKEGEERTGRVLDAAACDTQHKLLCATSGESRAYVSTCSTAVELARSSYRADQTCRLAQSVLAERALTARSTTGLHLGPSLAARSACRPSSAADLPWLRCQPSRRRSGRPLGLHTGTHRLSHGHATQRQILDADTSTHAQMRHPGRSFCRRSIWRFPSSSQVVSCTETAFSPSC
jgi:hypothetical protein